jgi:TRAP transporter 4TM/12TM fusion protein
VTADASQPVAARFRRPPGVLGFALRTLLIALPLVGITAILDPTIYFGIAVIREQYLGLFLGLALAAAFLAFPRSRSAASHRVPWYDVAAGFMGFAAGLYLTVTFPTLMFTGTSTAADLVFGVIAIAVVLEAVRRCVGWSLVVLVTAFFLYARFSDLIPGFFGGRGWSWERIIFFTYTDANSLLGIPLAVGGTVVVAFILFGEILFVIGGGKILTDFAIAALGRFRGGPAKVAVIASSLFATLSGSAVANVVLTGQITIPLMKKVGYPAHKAGAVEAAASTGGQIMPPVMGIGAFIMADLLGITYASVALAALVPALLYYSVLFVQVDLEAGKEGLRGLPARELPPLGPTLRMSWLVIVPLALLVYTLFILYLPPARAALFSALGALAVALLRREVRHHLASRLVTSLENAGRTLLELTVILASAGFVIGIMTGTGLGGKFSMALVIVGQGNLFLLLLLTALVSILMGMGMPTTVVYLLLAIFVAPALVKLGIFPLGAHLFIFYYGILSVITPPVAFASFAAAAVAGADSMRTGWMAARLGLLGYVIPFLFVFSPTLLLQGSTGEVVVSVTTALFGTWILGIALTGHFLRKISPVQRAILGLGAVGLLVPVGSGIPLAGWFSNLMGAAVVLPVIFREWLAARPLHAAALGGVDPPAASPPQG